jgi:hypothetical protein
MPQPRFDPQTDYYGMLGVSSSATLADIQAAYRRLAKTYHPDLHAGSPVAASRMTRLNFARTLLVDPVLRAAYDQARRQRFTADSTAERVTAATSAWSTTRVTATTWAPPRGATQIELRPWWDRSTLLMAVLVIPLVLVLGYYVAGAVQVAGRFNHPFLSDLALAPRTRPTAETIALELHGQLAGSLPSVRAARNASVQIDSVSESSSEALLLQSIEVRLVRAAAANDVQGWQDAVAMLCIVSHTCGSPTPSTSSGA